MNWGTTKNSIGITLQQGSLLKKYISGIPAIRLAYIELRKGTDFFDILYSQKVSDLYKKEKMMLNTRLPYKGVTEVKVLNKYSDTWNKAFNKIANIKNQGLILNIFSTIGEEAIKAGCMVIEELQRQGMKPVTINGVELNTRFTDFEGGEAGETAKLFNKDFLAIFSVNSVAATEFKQKALTDVYTLGKLQSKPIIVTSKQPMAIDGFRVINIGFEDYVKTEVELIKDIFGDKK